MLFCERDETHQPQLEPFLSLRQIRTIYISQDVFDDSEYYQEQEWLEEERKAAGIPSDTESDEEEVDGATRSPQDKDGDDDDEFVISKDRLLGGRPISLGSLFFSIRGIPEDGIERALPWKDEMDSLLSFFDPISVEIFGMPPFTYLNTYTSFPDVKIKDAPWTRLRRLVLHTCLLLHLPTSVVEGPLTIVCDSSKWWESQPSTDGVYDFLRCHRGELNSLGIDPFKCHATSKGRGADVKFMDLVVQDYGWSLTEMEEWFWRWLMVSKKEREQLDHRVRFEVLEEVDPSLKMPHSGDEFPPFP